MKWVAGIAAVVLVTAGGIAESGDTEKETDEYVVGVTKGLITRELYLDLDRLLERAEC